MKEGTVLGADDVGHLPNMKLCPIPTLIQFAKFSAKILLMAKLLQNYSNLNDLEYSRHLMARKVEKRPKKFLKAKQRPEVEKPKFS